MNSPSRITIVGRSSSHFTRVTRMFAAECGLDYILRPVPDLLSPDPEAYAGSPMLRIPILLVGDVATLGSLPIARKLHRLSGQQLRVLWPEDLENPEATNAQEIVTQAMATEVTLILLRATGAGQGDYPEKLELSLRSSLEWLDCHWDSVIERLDPARDVSFLEVTLFCLLEHLDFRKVVPCDHWTNLMAFKREFGKRGSAALTPYHYDNPTA